MFLGDMYRLDILRKTWSRVEYAGRGPVPPARSMHTMTAISQSTLVLFGGETGHPKNPASLNDVWTFDVRSRVWRQVFSSRDINTVSGSPRDSQLPSPRSLHTAVYGELPLPYGPCIYIYGGRGYEDSKTVFCLRISTWTWESLNGQQTEANTDCYPGKRDHHAAVWWPGGNGMIVAGGKCETAFLSDVWLFSPFEQGVAIDVPGPWQWRRLDIDYSKCTSPSQEVGFASHSLIRLEHNCNHLLLWGGLQPHLTSKETAARAILIDLQSQSARLVHACGRVPPTSRLIFTLTQCPTQDDCVMILHGGCDWDARPITSTQFVRLRNPDEFARGTTRASETKLPERFDDDLLCAAQQFEPITGSQLLKNNPEANGHWIDSSDKAPDISQDKKERSETVQSGSANALRNDCVDKRTSVIQRGTPLTGRILDVTEVGHFVSVIINGKEFKGVLVTGPAAGRDTGPRIQGANSHGNGTGRTPATAESLAPAKTESSERTSKRARTSSDDTSTPYLNVEIAESRQPKSDKVQRVQASEKVSGNHEESLQHPIHNSTGDADNLEAQLSLQTASSSAVNNQHSANETTVASPINGGHEQMRMKQGTSRSPALASQVPASTHTSTNGQPEGSSDHGLHTRGPPPFLPNVRDEIDENEVIDLG